MFLLMIDTGSLLAIYGGTFDPVHYGHLKPIEILANLIGLKQVIIMPNRIPPHRPKPEATITQRKHMLELAIADNPLFILHERELNRNVPSYTSQTLQEWRVEIGPNRPLAFIIGQDSLVNFPSWFQYESILNNAHLIVCRRSGYSLIMKKKHHQIWLNKHLTYQLNDLYKLPSGKIYLAETPWLNISATLIRQRLQSNLSFDDLIPTSVLQYIKKQGLYHQCEKY